MARSALLLSIVVVGACASPRANEPAPAPAPAEPAPYMPEPPPIDPAEHERALNAACGDPAKVARLLHRAAEGPTRAALDAYVASPAGPWPEETRAAVADVARAYLARCGLAETIELTGKLVELPTVSARQPAATGEAFRAMAELLAAWSKEAGLEFRVFGENDAWEIAYGSGAPSVAFVMHGDVVPIDDGVDELADARAAHAKAATSAIDPLTGEPLPPGWTRAPFRATLEDGRLYGRGTEDNKGPIAAALVVMRTLAKLNLRPAGRVLTIIGTAEEHDWSGMRRYANALAPKPPFTISVDANFPVVVAESGFVAWQLSAPLAPKKKPRAKCTAVQGVKAGQFLTQVPGEATLSLQPPQGERVDRFRARVDAATAAAVKALGEGYRFELGETAGVFELRAHGDAVHSSVAEEGKNALWALAIAGDHLNLCEGGVATLLRVVAREMAGDHWGNKLGLAYEHPQMGRLLVVPTLLRVDAGEAQEAKLGVNMRRPAGRTSEELGAALDGLVAKLKKTYGDALHESGERYVGEPALADTEGPLVPTLLDIYREATGDQSANVISIRGGTYARLFPGAVSFGPSLPGRKYRGHAPDEFIELDALALLDRALLEAVLRLDPRAEARRAELSKP